MSRSDLQTLLPYVTDAASVVFVATCVLILAAVAGEARSPGLAASMLSPQLLLGIAVVAGLISLVGEPRVPSVSLSARIGYMATGCIVTATIASVVWGYFAPFESVRLALTVASAVTAASIFILFRRSKKTA
jgi:hypothetical protein